MRRGCRIIADGDNAGTARSWPLTPRGLGAGPQKVVPEAVGPERVFPELTVPEGKATPR